MIFVTETSDCANFRLDIARPWFALSFFWFFVIISLGIAMRFSFAFNVSLPTPLDFTRHAHSHTAFWAWAGPAFFGFILAYCIDEGKRSPILESILFWGIQLVSFLALLSFILSGYSKLSILFSTLMVFLWLGFSFYLWRFGKKFEETHFLISIVRLAVLMLVISTIPTFLIPISVVTGFGGEMIKTISIHFFLDSYSEGWLYLMSFVFLVFLGNEKSFLSLTKFSKVLLFLSIPLLFLVFLRSNAPLFPKPFQVVIFLASFFWGLLQLIVIFLFVRKNQNYTFWFVSLLIIVKAILDIMAGLPMFIQFVQSKMFTLLYLHIKLLGVMSVIILNLVLKLYFPMKEKILHLNKMILLTITTTLIAMLCIAISSLPLNLIDGTIINPRLLWQYGQALAFIAAIPIAISILFLCIQLLYSAPKV